MVVLPMYLIRGLGLDALTAGLVLLPGGILQAIMSPVMGKLFDRFGPRWIVPLGLIVISTALFFLKGISESTSLILIMIMHTGLMVGICAVWMPSQTNGLNQLPPELCPHGKRDYEYDSADCRSNRYGSRHQPDISRQSCFYGNGN
ncbi:MFS transporter [Paenibacillus amylolyticus]|uniref:MFS transporter n=1 Tax=Paenibacillus amylolyticus TaxID=1451 RepID=UPI0039AFCCCB